VPKRECSSRACALHSPLKTRLASENIIDIVSSQTLNRLVSFICEVELRFVKVRINLPIREAKMLHKGP
jgi:hypothetical protein